MRSPDTIVRNTEQPETGVPPLFTHIARMQGIAMENGILPIMVGGCWDRLLGDKSTILPEDYDPLTHELILRNPAQATAIRKENGTIVDFDAWAIPYSHKDGIVDYPTYEEGYNFPLEERLAAVQKAIRENEPSSESASEVWPRPSFERIFYTPQPLGKRLRRRFGRGIHSFVPKFNGDLEIRPPREDARGRFFYRFGGLVTESGVEQEIRLDSYEIVKLQVATTSASGDLKVSDEFVYALTPRALLERYLGSRGNGQIKSTDLRRVGPHANMRRIAQEFDTAYDSATGRERASIERFKEWDDYVRQLEETSVFNHPLIWLKRQIYYLFWRLPLGKKIANSERFAGSDVSVSGQ